MANDTMEVVDGHHVYSNRCQLRNDAKAETRWYYRRTDWDGNKRGADHEIQGPFPSRDAAIAAIRSV